MTDTSKRYDVKFAREFREAVEGIGLCYQCGLCTGSCPSAPNTGMRTREVIQRALVGNEDVVGSRDIWLCTLCFNCAEHCRENVNPAEGIIHLRNKAVKAGNVPEHFLKTAKEFATGCSFPATGYTRKMRQELGLEPFEVTRKARQELAKLLESVGFGVGDKE